MFVSCIQKDIPSHSPYDPFHILETKEAQAIFQLLRFFSFPFLCTALAAAARNGEVSACMGALSAGENVDQRFEVNRGPDILTIMYQSSVFLILMVLVNICCCV